MRKQWINDTLVERYGDISVYDYRSLVSGDVWHAAINAALSDAAGVHLGYDGGKVLLPARTTAWNCEGAVVIPSDGVTLEGNGSQLSSRLVYVPGGDDWISPAVEGAQKVFINFQKSRNYLGRTVYSGTAAAGSTDTVLVFGAGSPATAVIGDVVRNNTTGAWAVVTSVASMPTSLTHTPLFGGAASWAVGDSCLVGGPGVLRRSALKNLAIECADAVEDKLAVRLFDCGQVLIQDVDIGYETGFRWTGADSTGIASFGREYLLMERVRVNACVPFRFGSRYTSYNGTATTNTGNNSVDHTVLRNFEAASSATPATLPDTSILISDQTQFTNLHIENGNLRGGKYGIYCSQTISSSASFAMTLHNLRVEQMDAASLWCFYLDWRANSLQQLRMTNIAMRGAEGQGGVYLNNVRAAFIQGRIDQFSAAAPVIQAADGNMQLLEWDFYVPGTTEFATLHSSLRQRFAHTVTGKAMAGRALYSGAGAWSASRSGTAVLAAGTATVALSPTEPDALYHLILSGNVAETFTWASKATGSFVINSSNGSSTASVDWVLVR